MEDDDFLENKPKQPAGRRVRFAPRGKTAAKPEPETKPTDLSDLKKPKTEETLDSSRTPMETATIDPLPTPPKQEPPKQEPSNGNVKMETKPVPEVEMEKVDQMMDTDEQNSEHDDDDMIVREIDVYFTPSVAPDTQLYVFQYPMRACWRPYDLDERCEEVRMKLSKSQVEIDLAIDQDSSNWDSEKAGSINITKQTLASSSKSNVANDYAVGVLIDDKLYLNPVHAVMQFRPSTACLQGVNLKGKNKDKPVESTSESKNSNDEESWVPLKYHGSKSDFSERYLEQMTTQENSPPIQFTMNSHDYFNSLCPGASNGTDNSKGSLRRVLLSMPLDERLKKLLREEPIHRYSVLKHYAPDYSDKDFLEVLDNHALLIQGLWVPRTSLLLFKDNAKSLVRDYILVLFSKDTVIKFDQISIDAKLKGHIKEFLNVFAVERPSMKDWKFKNQTDVSFMTSIMKTYPDIVQKQQKLIAEIEKKVAAVINRAVRAGPGAKNAKPSTSTMSNSGNGASALVTGNRAMSNETRETLRKALSKFILNHKICSKQGLRDWAVSQSTLPKADARVAQLMAEAVDTGDFEEVISEVACKIDGYYVSKSSQEHPEFDPLRKVVLDLLIGKGPEAKLRKSDVAEAARHVLRREMTGPEYTKVMSDICESKGSFWMLKKPK